MVNDDAIVMCYPFSQLSALGLHTYESTCGKNPLLAGSLLHKMDKWEIEILWSITHQYASGNSNGIYINNKNK